MKTEVKALDNAKKEISIEISGEVVKNKFEEVFKKIAQEAKIKGFRPGHAPRDILEKEYSSLAHEQVLKELIPELYGKAVEKENLNVLDMPDIKDVKLDRSSLSFKAEVEVYPEIEVKNYKNLKIKYKKAAVSADEIKRNLDSLKESRKIDNLDDSCAKSLGYPNLAELEKTVERQLSVQKDNAQRQEVEHQVVEQLTKGLEFKLPQALVSKQLEEMLRNAKMEMAIRGIPKENIAEHEGALVKELEPRAKEQVKVYLVLNAIAKKENIPSDEHMPAKVLEFVFKAAAWEIVEG
jgi:FKBP-type peptidyl-prolyl cis-trans isomerase (trigger factor)